jgi:N-acetylneuraminate synthase
MKQVKIGKRWVGEGEPAYLIAEIGSNFDGSIARAKKLIDLAKDCGADCAKFQCFTTDKIISKEGFSGLQTAFQAKWKKPVHEVYKGAEFPRAWHKELFAYCRKAGLDFMSAPYDREAVDILDALGVPAFKIGSGDITWLSMLRYIARKKKPVILAAGASTLAEVDEAVAAIKAAGNPNIILLQCVTNYPSHFENAHIRAMKAMGDMFNVPYGYSDHTPGSVVPLGAVALGACLIEKHFTDDKARKGPDHPFAMDGNDFKEMCTGIRNLEKALGSTVKELYAEESQTVILQRRCLRAAADIPQGARIGSGMIAVLRPCPKDALAPKFENVVIGKKTRRAMKKGDPFSWAELS